MITKPLPWSVAGVGHGDVLTSQCRIVFLATYSPGERGPL